MNEPQLIHRLDSLDEKAPEALLNLILLYFIGAAKVSSPQIITFANSARSALGAPALPSLAALTADTRPPRL